MPVTVVHSVLEPGPAPEGCIAGGMFGNLFSLLQARDMGLGAHEAVPLLVLKHVEPVRLNLLMVLQGRQTRNSVRFGRKESLASRIGAKWALCTMLDLSFRIHILSATR